MLSLEDRQLAWILGLGDLGYKLICHGYQHGCECVECSDRANMRASKPVRQPWEPEQRAA